MLQIKKDIQNTIGKRKAVFLFTGSKESTMLMDMISDIDIKTVFIDTGFHFDEMMDYVKSFGSKIEVIKDNSASVDLMVDMDRCCAQRKREVLNKYLKNIRAEYLIVPFRDEEKDNMIEESYLRGISDIRIIRPLADLTDRDIWIKIKQDNLSYSKIYNRGYGIVDCKACTTRLGRKEHEKREDDNTDRDTEEKLKSLGYM